MIYFQRYLRNCKNKEEYDKINNIYQLLIKNNAINYK